jgi:hypothetical protein
LLVFFGLIVFTFIVWLLYYFTSIKIMIICLITLLVIGTSGYLYFNTNWFVKSTNLGDTSILNLKIGDILTESIKKRIDDHYGPEVNDPEMAILLSVNHDRALKYKGLFIGIRSNKIVAIVIENKLISTNKGLCPMDLRNEIETKYGGAYVSKSEEIGDTLSYIDKENQITLKFVMNGNQIKQVVFSESN